MIAYLDSSVLLRVVLGEPGLLPEWKLVAEGVCSTLAQVECLRTIGCLRTRGASLSRRPPGGGKRSTGSSSA